MAIVWSQLNGEDLYQVRTAGNSVRLYTNGVFHSQWNPHNLLTRSVWDSLSIAAFFLEPPQLRRVLLMGVGGGVVIKQLKKLFPNVSIVGVELASVHISVARQWFKVGSEDATLIHADACQWLKDYEGPPFDLIIDDLFGDTNGEVARAVPVDQPWAQLLCKHLSDDGVLTVNFIGKPELRKSALYGVKEFKTRQCFTPPHCENAVSVFCKNKTPIVIWKQRVKADQTLKESEKKAILGYTRRAF